MLFNHFKSLAEYALQKGYQADVLDNFGRHLYFELLISDDCETKVYLLVGGRWLQETKDFQDFKIFMTQI